jgi:DNA-binding IclR family transcriptional regulator
VPLTHELLAELVAARRPSVSTALSTLAAAGRIERDGPRWTLRGDPPSRGDTDDSD